MWNLVFTKHVEELVQRARLRCSTIKHMGALYGHLPPWLARSILETMMGTLLALGMGIWGQPKAIAPTKPLARQQRYALQHLLGTYYIPGSHSSLEAETGIDYIGSRMIGGRW